MALKELPFTATGEDEVDFTVVDLGVARALWEGVPVARLLARIRLFRDERDLVDANQRASGINFDHSSWDVAIARLLANAPSSLERVKRAVARHARAASDEGPLAATDATLAALIHAHLSSSDADASPAEGAAEALPIEDSVRLACSRMDERLGQTAGDRRAAPFEACLELARRQASASWPIDGLRHVLGALTAIMDPNIHDSGQYPSIADLPDAIVPATSPLYPWSDGPDVPVGQRRACLVDRPSLERIFLQPKRDLDATASRAANRYPKLPIAPVVADVAPIVSKHGALLLVAVREPRSMREAPPLPQDSWRPAGLDTVASAITIASALERGAITAPRARSVLVRGGEQGFDAMGKEMLNVAAHPFASSVFAELMAPYARERDVVRLVTYFAIAPDPSPAARALSLCPAREVVCSVLKAWLETMLPADGMSAPPGADPDTSASARITSCVEALRPYPHLFQVIEPLLSRLSSPPKDA